MPPTDARRNSNPTSSTVTEPPIATIGTQDGDRRRVVEQRLALEDRHDPAGEADPRDSGRGHRARRATTAPRAIAAEKGIPIRAHVTRPTPAAVKITIPTDSPMTFLFAPRSTNGVRIAAAYRRGRKDAEEDHLGIDGHLRHHRRGDEDPDGVGTKGAETL